MANWVKDLDGGFVNLDVMRRAERRENTVTGVMEKVPVYRLYDCGGPTCRGIVEASVFEKTISASGGTGEERDPSLVVPLKKPLTRWERDLLHVGWSNPAGDGIAVKDDPALQCVLVRRDHWHELLRLVDLGEDDVK